MPASPCMHTVHRLGSWNKRQAACSCRKLTGRGHKHAPPARLLQSTNKKPWQTAEQAPGGSTVHVWDGMTACRAAGLTKDDQ